MNNTLQYQSGKSETTKLIDYAPLARKQKRPFKPAIHRTASLCLLLAIAFGFIALIEYSLRVLPHHSVTNRNDLNSGYDKRDHKNPFLDFAIGKREEAARPASAFPLQLGSETLVPADVGPTPTTPAATPGSATTSNPIHPTNNLVPAPSHAPGSFTGDEQKTIYVTSDKPTVAASHVPESFTGGEQETISVTPVEPPRLSVGPGGFTGGEEATITPVPDPGPTDIESPGAGRFDPGPTTVPVPGPEPPREGEPPPSSTTAPRPISPGQVSPAFEGDDVSVIKPPAPTVPPPMTQDPEAFGGNDVSTIPVESQAGTGFWDDGVATIAVADGKSDGPRTRDQYQHPAVFDDGGSKTIAVDDAAVAGAGMGFAANPKITPAPGDKQGSKDDNTEAGSPADHGGDHKAAAGGGSKDQGHENDSSSGSSSDNGREGPDGQSAGKSGNKGGKSGSQGGNADSSAKGGSTSSDEEDAEDGQHTGDDAPDGDTKDGTKAIVATSDSDDENGDDGDGDGDGKSAGQKDGGSDDTKSAGDDRDGDETEGKDSTKSGSGYGEESVSEEHGTKKGDSSAGSDATDAAHGDGSDDNDDDVSSDLEGFSLSNAESDTADESDVSDEGKPFTTTISGHEVVITPHPSKDGKPYTTTISGQEVVITPHPSKDQAGRGSKKEKVFTSCSGDKCVLLTSTLGSSEQARLANKVRPTASRKQVSVTRTGAKGEPTETVAYTVSSVPLTFTKKPVHYFYGIYFPVFLAVVYQMMIGYLYTATKMMEPFAMLSRPNGVPAKDFLWINYLSPNDNFEPFIAMASGHWLMLWVAVLFTAAQLLSPLSSEMLGLYPSYYKVNDEQAVIGTSVWVHPQIARLMQAILVLICLLLISLWFILRRNQSHIYSDPSSIAGVASLTHHPETVRTFSSLSQTAPKEEILETLAGTRWRLGPYPAPDGSGAEHYGIIPAHAPSPLVKLPTTPLLRSHSVSPPGHWPASGAAAGAATATATAAGGRAATPASMHLLASPPYRKKLRTQLLLNLLLLLLTLALLGLITAYHLNSTDNGFERFMDAQTFGPRFLLTTVGIVLKSQWSRLERRAVVIEPFRLAHRARGAPSSVLHEQRTLIPVTTLAAALYRRRPTLMLLATNALLAEGLVIVLPGIPFDPRQKYLASWVSRAVAMGILGFGTLSLVGFWGWKVLRWRGKVKVGREPNTLGGMVGMVAGTGVGEEGSRDTDGGGGARGSDEDGRRVVLVRRRRDGVEGGGEEGEERVVVEFEGGKEKLGAYR